MRLNMQLNDFNYCLPDALIAQTPLPERMASKLLLINPETGHFVDQQFSDLQSFLKPGDLLVFNNTQVIPARLFGQKVTGGKVEVTAERIIDTETILAHIRASRAPKPGARLWLEGQIDCRLLARQGDLFLLRQHSKKSWIDWLQSHGHIPLPPYIQRQASKDDRERYQTVYASVPGAIAAPTAGLHFNRHQIREFEAAGINIAYITLHVGAGTFQPVRVNDIDHHVMHAERVEVSTIVCDQVAQVRAAGGRVIAVGTTVVRSLETAAVDGQLQPFSGDSKLFIKPGFRFQIVDAMITNFHLPKSTLLMLVSAFAGTALIQQAYQHAIDRRYRFFSYGDAMLITARAR